jgi:hypothetical protein
MLTLNDVMERLKKIDEVSLLEVLEINSEEIVDRFVDKIEANFEELEEELHVL